MKFLLASTVWITAILAAFGLVQLSDGIIVVLLAIAAVISLSSLKGKNREKK